MPGTANRDLASVELWQESLVRSQRRRVLAADARKDQARKKTAAGAVTAAVAAAPMWPSVTASASDLSTQDAGKLARQMKHNHAERVLLAYGDTSSAVAEVQRALGIADDGIFGPQTRAAVKAFQRKHGLLPTGKVDVKTWLKLFPTDMIVYAPPGSASALGVNDTSHPEWAAVSTDPSGEGSGHSGTAEVGHAAAAKTKLNGTEHDPGTPSVNAASIGATGPAASIGPNGSGPGSGAGIVPGVLGGIVAPNGGGAGGGGWTPHFPPLSSFGSAAEMIRAMIRMANKIDAHHYAYRWGGGHNASFSGPYDCSGAVSAVLHAAGLLSRPMVSGEFMHWGAPGRGAVTIYANAGHVYMSILGRFFGTSGANPGGGAGWFRGGPRPGFAVVHVPFSALHFKGHRKRHHKRHRRRHARRHIEQSGPLNQPATTPPPSTTGGSQAPSSSSPSAPTTTAATNQPAGTSTPTQSTAAQPVPTQPVAPAPTAETAPPQQVQPVPAPTAPAAPNAPATPEAATPATGSVPASGPTPNGSGPAPAPATPPASAPAPSSDPVTPAPQAPKPAAAPQPQQPAQTPSTDDQQTAQRPGQAAEGAAEPPKPPAGGGQPGQGATPNAGK